MGGTIYAANAAIPRQLQSNVISLAGQRRSLEANGRCARFVDEPA
jgi:hypothetical protein